MQWISARGSCCLRLAKLEVESWSVRARGFVVDDEASAIKRLAATAQVSSVLRIQNKLEINLQVHVPGRRCQEA